MLTQPSANLNFKSSAHVNFTHCIHKISTASVEKLEYTFTF